MLFLQTHNMLLYDQISSPLATEATFRYLGGYLAVLFDDGCHELFHLP